MEDSGSLWWNSSIPEEGSSAQRISAWEQKWGKGIIRWGFLFKHVNSSVKQLEITSQVLIHQLRVLRKINTNPLPITLVLTLLKSFFSSPILMKSKQSPCRLSKSPHRPQQHSHTSSASPKQLSGKELRNYLTPSTWPRIVLCADLASTFPQHKGAGHRAGGGQHYFLRLFLGDRG